MMQKFEFGIRERLPQSQSGRFHGKLYAAILAFCLGVSCRAQAPFDARMNDVADRYLTRRAEAVAQLHTRAEAEARARQFREFVLSAIGGLPKERTPLAPQVVGTLHRDGFDVERVIYDSLPGFHVTANLYLPKTGNSPFPAVLYTPGHYPVGKVEAWTFAANMARNGIAVLVYDPIGEGERLQYFDPTLKASRAGKPTGEHTEASVQIALTGDHIARYFLWDAMRGIDYLESRPEIDAKRIGAFGCSGGGTVTAYLTAFDRRVKATGTACYITEFHNLLGTIGPQEAEQTIPGFIQHGYDLPDWVEAAAPTPYAVISTTEDMFPFEGARRAVEEARRVYGLFGPDKKVDWITGPGRHANLRPIYSEIIHFFLRQLRGVDETPKVMDFGVPPVSDLECTTSGQVTSSLRGETLFSLNRAAAQGTIRKQPEAANRADVTRLRKRLSQQIRSLNGIGLGRSANPLKITLTNPEKRTGYSIQHATFTSTTGQDLNGILAVPDKIGRKPAVLLLEERAAGEAAQDEQLDRLARHGNVVFAPEVLPGPGDRDEQKTDLLGPFYLPSLRAQLLGKTLVGLRIEDAERCIDWLAARRDVDSGRISGRGSGAMGIVFLHAAVLDDRIRALTLDRMLIGYRAAVDAPLTKDLAQSVIPGVLRRYDLGDLMVALAPRAIELIAPTDGGGDRIDAHDALAWVLQTDQKLGYAGRLKLSASEESEPAGH
jgi:cephalosporin-C deacetylase-like acetyl esterase